MILTNADGAVNFKLVTAPVDDPGREHWEELVPHRPDVKLEGVSAFADHLVRYERREGVRRIVVTPVRRRRPSTSWPCPRRCTTPAPPPTPSSTTTHAALHLHVARHAGHRVRRGPRHRRAHAPQDHRGARRPRPGRLRHRPALGHRPRRRAGADLLRAPRRRRARRHRARASSTATAPTRRASTRASRSLRLSLLDRGFVFAIAHVRGGGEMGRPWYDDGKLLHKRNTFTDFIACAEHLVAEGFTAPDRLVARGASAGGLLMGAVTNLRPDLFAADRGRGALRRLPHHDPRRDAPAHRHRVGGVGQPRRRTPAVYDYMAGYSPYDNVAEQAYPTILATGGLNDPRVSYWEPAKWVHKLRGVAPRAAEPIYLKTEMGAGHQGPSGPLRRVEGRGVRVRLHPRRARPELNVSPGRRSHRPGRRPSLRGRPAGQDGWGRTRRADRRPPTAVAPVATTTSPPRRITATRASCGGGTSRELAADDASRRAHLDLQGLGARRVERQRLAPPWRATGAPRRARAASPAARG